MHGLSPFEFGFSTASMEEAEVESAWHPQCCRDNIKLEVWITRFGFLGLMALQSFLRILESPRARELVPEMVLVGVVSSIFHLHTTSDIAR